ncbi:uncharacterized protein K444DRAFT_617508 [Hyaloscypha bicolor E]|uniref:Uncharacterized protein n=1 Tax=Hyaloscypha bicolor E TaxID=1095630 RepID=A0A2J6SWD4_9HELO|nr:uncharacterized protein K444DRAFT_617508 [Hyaloscypha bicolor E]PMD55066.1 hypothetical protein K444DRAFT_617508 [Hyaloscypha bicolor E]
MAAPPQNNGNWNSLSPQRPDAYAPKPRQQVQKVRVPGTIGAQLGRIETPSGIPGLTFDHAGRPVWREENAVKAETEHRENRW